MRDGRNIGCSWVGLTAILLALISTAQAETLVTTVDGEEYSGDVVSAGMNTMTIKLRDTGYQIVPLDLIDQIRVDTVDGGPVEGDYVDWNDGEIVVRVGDREVVVRDGVIASVSDQPAAAGGPKLPEPSSSEPTPPPELAPPPEQEIPESGPITSATM